MVDGIRSDSSVMQRRGPFGPRLFNKNICIIHWREIGPVKRQLSENLAPAIRSGQVQSRAGGTNQRRPKPAAHLAHILPTTSANAKPDGATLLVNSMVSRPCATGCQPQTGCKSGFQNTPPTPRYLGAGSPGHRGAGCRSCPAGAAAVVRQVLPRWPPSAVPSVRRAPARCFWESAQLEWSALLKTATGAFIH